MNNDSDKKIKAEDPGELNVHQVPQDFQLNTAVLFLVFKRLNTTKLVFEAIRQARPPRLFVAADGPRKNNSAEAQKVAEVRSYIMSNIDWDCEIQTLFRDENLGCKYAISGAITWFFGAEKEGIILEDDCLANRDFFRYCEWALSTYRDDSRVWHINGNNFAAPSKMYHEANISFSALAQVWGWATWRDRWAQYTDNSFYLMHESRQMSRSWNISLLARAIKLQHIVELQNGLDTWDFQWQVTVLNHAGLCLTCRSNLISNIGDDDEATHPHDDPRTHLATAAIRGRLEYEEPELSKRLTVWYEKKMGLTSVRLLARASSDRLLGKLNRVARIVMASILFWGIKPIVIASSGRSGSTMLSTAIAESLVRHRYKVKPTSWLGSFLTDLAFTFTARVSDVKSSPIPVHKTHGLLPPYAPSDTRFVFIYSDPLESALSVQRTTDLLGRLWFEQHLYHLESQGSYSDLFEKDVLNYEEQIDSWMRNPSTTVFHVRYEEVWEKIESLSEYLGFQVVLPRKRERSLKSNVNKINEELFAYLRSLTIG